MTGRHAIDVDLLIDALRRADPDVVMINAEYEVVTQKYRPIAKERNFHVQAKPGIIRCAPPVVDLSWDSMARKRSFEPWASSRRSTHARLSLRSAETPVMTSGDADMLELWMASTNVGTLIDARRDDEEDIISGVSQVEMIGDSMFDVTFFDPRSGEVEYQSLNARDLA